MNVEENIEERAWKVARGIQSHAAHECVCVGCEATMSVIKEAMVRLLRDVSDGLVTWMLDEHSDEEEQDEEEYV